MRILKTLGLALAALVALLFIVGFFLPDHTHMERSITIDAAPAEVYGLVNDLPSWNQWSPWYEKEPDATWAYSSPASGKGAWYTWVGEELGKGKMTIVDVVPNKRIDAEMEFEGQGGAEADFFFEPTTDGKTEVTWAFEADHDGVMDRWFGVMLDKFLGPDYERGLSNLKAAAES